MGMYKVYKNQNQKSNLWDNCGSAVHELHCQWSSWSHVDVSLDKTLNPRQIFLHFNHQLVTNSVSLVLRG